MDNISLVYLLRDIYTIRDYQVLKKYNFSILDCLDTNSITAYRILLNDVRLWLDICKINSEIAISC